MQRRELIQFAPSPRAHPLHSTPPTPPTRRSDKFVASRRLLSMAGVRMRQYTPSRESIVLDFRV